MGLQHSRYRFAKSNLRARAGSAERLRFHSLLQKPQDLVRACRLGSMGKPGTCRFAGLILQRKSHFESQTYYSWGITVKTRSKTAVIIGAGPAGLTAAFELLRSSDIKPIVLEKSDQMGGISRTVNYKGNRMDIGGHRFFSKSDRVMNWWFEHMPLETTAKSNGNGHGRPHLQIAYQNQKRDLANCLNGNQNGCHPDLVMLVRRRKSRIYFLRNFFDYPITLSKDTLAKLGPIRTLRIGLSYMRSAA